MTTVKLLDHGYLRLVDCMPREEERPRYPGITAADARVIDAARVSNVGITDEERSQLKNERLINYLMEHEHHTPFEHVHFTFAAKMPIFVARQWVRHRAASINEISARYAKLPCEFYVPATDRMQAQSTSNKQGSGAVLPAELANGLRDDIRDSSQRAYTHYENILSDGLSRELARMVLPTNFYTEWYWSANLRMVLHFLGLRCDPHVQYEMRVYADAMFEMVNDIAPLSTAAFFRYLK